MEKTLDLHGVKHNNAFRTIDQFIGTHIQKGTAEVEIITGYSKHMKGIVENVAQDYGANCKESWMNAGKIVVDLR
jgi:DNA-nicking Smr family endonuclease